TTDSALGELRRGDIAAAVRVWEVSAQRPCSSIKPIHNLAALHHALALDLERTSSRRSLTQAEQKELEDHWWQALRWWEMALGAADFWKEVDARVLDIDDPRITNETVTSLRDSLPLALLDINAHLAVNYAETGDFKEAKRQTELMRIPGFERGIE